MSEEEKLKIIQGVQIAIQEAIGRAQLMGILQDIALAPLEKVALCKEVLKGVKAAIEKIKSNGTAI